MTPESVPGDEAVANARDRVADLNLVAGWLARRDGEDPLAEVPSRPAFDVVVVPGSEVLSTLALATAVYSLGRARWLMPVGGIGHGTPGLRRVLRADPRLAGGVTDALSEGELLAHAARAWGVPNDALLIETESTNCGANAVGCRRVLEENGIDARRMLILQDPTMQRRTHASFQQAWRDVASPPEFVSWAVEFPPLSVGENGDPAWSHSSAPWPVERFVGLVLGEVPRLRDDAEGYGPRGRGYLPSVPIPAEVEAAWQRAHAHFSGSLAQR